MSAVPKPRRKKFQLNPAFADAHGLAKGSSPDAKKDAWDKINQDLSDATSTLSLLNVAVEKARKDGKLALNSIGLNATITSANSPLRLPDAIFDLRNDLIGAYNGEMNIDEKFWQCYGEEMLTLVDLSDNDLSSEAATFISNSESNDKEEGKRNIPSALDDRIGCYKALQALRIRNCNLDDIPWSTIGENLTALRLLDAIGNQFTVVPLRLLPKGMKTLHLADNQINSLGEDTDIIHLPELTHLDVGNNSLKRLPSTLDSTKLQQLILAKNKIESISEAFLYSSRHTLRSLDLSENRLSSSMDFSEHSELMILELRCNKILVVPKIHKNLMKLGLSFNSIEYIDGIFSDQCNDDGMTPDGEWFRSKLSELHLEKNALKKELHAPSLAVMTNLSMLDMSHNELENIPPVVGYLPMLNKILLDGNPFRMIRSAIKYKPTGGIDTQKLLKSLRNKRAPPPGPGYHGSNTANEAGAIVKNIVNGTGTACSSTSASDPESVKEANEIAAKAASSDCHLTIDSRRLSGEMKWPELISAFMTETTDRNGQNTTYGSLVKSWKMCNGRLMSIGKEWVEALPRITRLEAYRNQIESLPNNFSQLPLESLEMARNRLTSPMIQDQICEPASNLVAKLTILDLSSNKIKWVPGALFNLSMLTSLNLSCNQIKTLQWEYNEDGEAEGSVCGGRGWKHGLVYLNHLDLSNNSICDLGYLPLALSGCKQLRSLLLNNNAIDRIPLELGLLTQLTNIDLLGNTQRHIRVRVLTQTCSRILKYLRDRMSAEELEEARENHKEIEMALEDDMGHVAQNKISDQISDDVSEDPKRTNYYSDGKENDENIEQQSQSGKNNGAGDDMENKNGEIEEKQRETSVAESTPGINPKASSSTKEHMHVSHDTHSAEAQVPQHQPPPADDDVIASLEKNIAGLSEQLESLSISQAKRFALKKALAMERSKLIRAKRSRK